MGCRGFYAFREKLEGVLDPGSEILTCIILKTARSIFKLWISSDGICYFIIAEFGNWFGVPPKFSLYTRNSTKRSKSFKY